VIASSTHPWKNFFELTGQRSLRFFEHHLQEFEQTWP
jgi:hypothetical protein